MVPGITQGPEKKTFRLFGLSLLFLLFFFLSLSQTWVFAVAESFRTKMARFCSRVTSQKPPLIFFSLPLLLFSMAWEGTLMTGHANVYGRAVMFFSLAKVS